MKQFLKILLWTNAVFMFGLNILINCNVINASVLNSRSMSSSLADSCGATGEPTCMAGGCKATGCSFSGSIAGNHVSTKIDCEEGSYACCHIKAYCFSKTVCGNDNGNDNC